ncbi:MAG: sigma-70 family RNA polymerase sigma factor [Anaerolineales bacterium]|nr:sigma-70 family RNA polymerase sigma factor [Anaerolineales bacterium]
MSALIVDGGADGDFLRRLQLGDNGAWTELTRDYSPRLFSYLRHNLPTSADAEDALSETMLAAVRSLPNFDGKVAISTYLYSLAYRKVADFWRRRQHVTELTESAAVTEMRDEADLEEALNELPEISKQVLLLRYQVGLSVSEIAEVIDRSYKGTESLLSRARSQLRETLDQAGLENGR